MTTYHQLTQEQRYQIKAFLSIGMKKTHIAAHLGVHKATLSRELKRNTGQRGYRPKQAHEKTLARRQSKAQPRISTQTWAMVEAKLQEDWSPEQIAGRLKKEAIRVSHERIYQYVYTDKRAGGQLWRHLRTSKKYRKRAGGRDRRGRIPARRSIDLRPALVEERQRLGDWEGDLLLGANQQGLVLTLTERKSRFTLLRSLASKQAAPVTQAIIDLLHWVTHRTSLTFDNGKEFAGHQEITRALKMDCYFAHPYASWERGTNENTNGLLRQYLPKTRTLKDLSTKEEMHIMDRLNLRPRKCLAFMTPYEVFFEQHLVALTC